MASPGKAAMGEIPGTLQLKQRLLELEQELSQSRSAERHFQRFLDRVKDYAFIAFDPDGRIVSWSRGAEHIFGYSESEVLGEPGSLIFTPEDRVNGEDKDELGTARRDGCAEDERWHLRRDGTRFWGSGIMTAHRDQRGNIEGFSKVMRDLTSRQLTEQRLRDAEERFRLFADNVRDYALVPVDTDANISGWNSGAQRTFGYTENEIVGQPVKLFFTPEDREKGESEKDLSRALAQGRAEGDRWMVRRDGSRFWSRWVTTPMYDPSGVLRGYAKVLRDETARKNAENAIEKSLHEKDLLLREIHHRVKNNLAVISSLLSLQAGQVADDEVQRMFDELQDRVRSIATLHQTLYGSRDLANIDFGPYMQQLVQDLMGFYGIDQKRIQVHVKSDDVVLSIEQALPLGLIVNELASNALKHAFSGGRRGEIDVQFQYLAAANKEQSCSQGWCELTVQDNGIGISNADGLWDRKSMGLKIVRLLTDQLRGRVELERSSRTRFAVRFPLEKFRYAGEVLG